MERINENFQCQQVLEKANIKYTVSAHMCFIVFPYLRPDAVRSVLSIGQINPGPRYLAALALT